MKKDLHKNAPCHGYFRRGVFVVSGADQKYGKVKKDLNFDGNTLSLTPSLTNSSFDISLDSEINWAYGLYGNGFLRKHYMPARICMVQNKRKMNTGLLIIHLSRIAH